ncbi:MAG: UDP-N-acetylmuramate dehydrogenase [Clostridia bacterium]|nr:UDP-N-acetylmuramate dehydrogenase [Clostridia bacterium]
MKEYTTFKTGGAAKVIIEPETPIAVAQVLRALKERGESYYVLGNGSNLLVADEGIDIPIIHIGKKLSEVRVDGESVICQAGALLSGAATAAYKSSLTGLEFAHGIPGSVGGGVCMNAGAYGGELKDVIDWIDYASPSGEVCRMDCDTANLSYRHSFFSDKDYVVTAACFKLKAGNIDEILGKMKLLGEKRRDKQPLEYPSAGSTFKRPAGGFAAALIEEAGLKGTCCGDAVVSEKHSGFIVNKGNATTGDILNLMETVKEKVYKKSGIMLEPEVKFWK